MLKTYLEVVFPPANGTQWAIKPKSYKETSVKEWRNIIVRNHLSAEPVLLVNTNVKNTSSGYHPVWARFNDNVLERWACKSPLLNPGLSAGKENPGNRVFGIAPRYSGPEEGKGSGGWTIWTKKTGLLSFSVGQSFHTDPFAVLEYYTNMLNDVPELHRISRSHDITAIRLYKGQSVLLFAMDATFFFFFFWFGEILGSALRAEFPISPSNHVGFTPRLLYSSTSHLEESFTHLKTDWAQDDWLQWGHKNWYFHLDISS